MNIVAAFPVRIAGSCTATFKTHINFFLKTIHPKIQLLKNHQVDRQKWDACIVSATNGLVYARAFYLDNMSVGWDALVGEDYEWAFPITHRRKYGINYLSQPPLSQQLGVFAKPNINPPYEKILEWLKQHYRFWAINLNYATDTALINSPIKINAATNFILNLSDNYENISAKYHKDHIKNIKRSKKFRLLYQPGDDYNKAIQLFIDHYAPRLSNIKPADYKNFANVCAYAKEKNKLVIREVLNDASELLSIALILWEGNRLYNLMNITTQAGRKVESNHFLFDSLFKEFCGRELIFDFEGSDVPGVNRFYRNFGGEDQPFFLIEYNNLPWPLRLLKK